MSYEVSLISASNSSQATEHLGTAYLASFLRSKGVLASLHHLDAFLPKEQLITELPRDSKLYGFSLCITNYKKVYQLSAELKKINPDCLIFLGGHLATPAAKEILLDCQDIDFVVLGDGEVPIYEVIKAVRSNQDIEELPAIATRRTKGKKLPSVVTNIKEMPWPARDYLEDSIKNGALTARMLAARGCCANCSFCSYNMFSKENHTKTWVGRDVEDVFAEMVHIYETYGLRSFSFNDGSLEDPGRLGKQRLEQLCKLLLDYPIRFHLRCFARAETFTEEDIPLIKLMREAGITHVYIGIESAHENDLALYQKRATLADNSRCLRLFTDHDIDVSIGFIMFNPLSTYQTLRSNYNYLKDHNAFCISYYTNQIQVYCGTPLETAIRKLGLLDQDYSYKKPLGYRFENSYIQEICDFLNHEINLEPLYQKENEFSEFLHFYNSMRAMFPDELKQTQIRVEEIKSKFTKVLAEYFQHLLWDVNLTKAKAEFPAFENKYTEIYDEFKKEYLTLIIKKNIRKFLMTSTDNFQIKSGAPKANYNTLI